jgi:hypothetical protein
MALIARYFILDDFSETAGELRLQNVLTAINNTLIVAFGLR